MGEVPKTPTDYTGTIHVIPYTHADVAWIHTRAWHIDRYVRDLDEVLDLLDADPDYRYYLDTWTELMKPYVALRPERLEALRRHIREPSVRDRALADRYHPVRGVLGLSLPAPPCTALASGE